MSKLPSLLLLPALVLGQLPGALTGRWTTTADFYGTPINFAMELNQQGDKLTGNFGGDKLEGAFTGNSIHFLAKDEQAAPRS